MAERNEWFMADFPTLQREKIVNALQLKKQIKK